jgi:hypothetical protein
LLIGVKTGKCDICKETKKTLLLRFGFSLCEECLSVCTTVLEQLEFEETEKAKKRSPAETKQVFPKQKFRRP